MLTQVVAGRVFDYSHCVGRQGLSISIALGQRDVVYVLSRGSEFRPAVHWSRAARGSRVGIFTIGTEPGDEESVGEFGRYGTADGEFIWPAGLGIDSQENLYVTDEWLNRVSVFDREGTLLGQWGVAGEGDGEFNGPSGIALDSNDDAYVVDSRNHRVQKFTKEGKFLSKWGRFGTGDGEFNSPWGITLDHQGDVYVADHKNHRAQKFTSEGGFLAAFGSHGTGRGQLNRPSDVAVDPDGDVYVCDWGNNRVQMFGPEGRFVTSFIGDAHELNKWAKMAVEADPAAMKRRREVRSLEPEWRLALPTAVAFDEKKSRLLIADTQRNRLQIYNKLKDYAQPQRNL